MTAIFYQVNQLMSLCKHFYYKKSYKSRNPVCEAEQYKIHSTDTDQDVEELTEKSFDYYIFFHYF